MKKIQVCKMILYIMKMKFYNLVLLTTAFVALLFLYYVKVTTVWSINIYDIIVLFRNLLIGWLAGRKKSFQLNLLKLQ